MNEISLDAQWHLRAELSRVLSALDEILIAQRVRGRTPAADAVRGLVIEEGEAEGLVAELAARWTEAADDAPQPGARAMAEQGEIIGLAERAQRQGAFLPLRHAALAFELRPVEYDAVLLALAAELDARFGRLFAYLNDHVGHTRPTLGLALGLEAGRERAAASSPLHLLERPALRDGLIELEGEGPLPGRALRLSSEMAPRLTADHALDPHPGGTTFSPVYTGLLDRLVLSDAVRSATATWVAEARARPANAPCLMVAGAPGSGRATLVRAATSAAGASLVTLTLDASTIEEQLRIARRDARWYEAALLVEVTDPETRWSIVWSALEPVAGFLSVSVPSEVAETAANAATRETAMIAIGAPDAELRARLWQAVVPPGVELDPGAADALATSFHFNPGRIAQAIHRAQAELRLHAPGERRLSAQALNRAARAVGRSHMGGLAQRLPCPYEAEDLVVPPRVKAELDLALAWVRQQRTVLGDWGFADRVPFGEGLSVLFSGPPGTGKTMAAQVLARQLDLDLYRVDLSRVVSKYIGETEKNLGQLFDESHQSGAILFFDEADALFGKRSEVKDAHDRYANVEIGYLLQRMEEHDGIVILATNRQQDMDEAFTRRFDVIVSFPMPDEAHRLRIWESMFPAAAVRDEGLDFRPLARKFELSGGEIRNVVLAAAYLAADEGRPIAMSHLKKALMRELRKSGRAIAEDVFRDLHA